MVDVASLRIGFAFTLGTATFFAPCALPLLPGYVAFFIGSESETGDKPVRARVRQAFVVALLTSFGFFLVFGALFGIATAVGAQALADVALLELIVGGLLVILGVAMASGRLDTSAIHVQLPERRRGPLGYVTFGVIYAVAAAGCTAPAFIGIAAFGISSGPVTAVAVFGAYAAGMSVLMVGVTLLAAVGRDAVVRYAVSNTRLVTRVAGAILALAGLVQIYWFLFVLEGLETYAFVALG